MICYFVRGVQISIRHSCKPIGRWPMSEEAYIKACFIWKVYLNGLQKQNFGNEFVLEMKCVKFKIVGATAVRTDSEQCTIVRRGIRPPFYTRPPSLYGHAPPPPFSKFFQPPLFWYIFKWSFDSVNNVLC